MKLFPRDQLPPDLAALVDTLHEDVNGQLCPRCEGGRTGERTLSLRLDGSLIVRLSCWRASCGFRAAVLRRDTDGSEVKLVSSQKFQPRYYRRPLHAPTRPMTDFMFTKYTIGAEACMEFMQQTEKPLQAYLPVLGPDKRERGGVLRFFDGSKPKTVAYPATDLPWQAWYVAEGERARKELVIVEDQLSALRCWQLGYTSVALLGTNLSGGRVEEIRKTVNSSWEFHLCLDRDAFNLACRYAKRHPWLTPRLLDRDFKDIGSEQILGVLGG